MHQVRIVHLPGNNDLPLPEKMSVGSSGFDLHATVKEITTINPGESALIPTGIAIAMPPNLEAQVRSRSGLALKHGICVLNSPGTIDSDYRGEICVILYNVSATSFKVERGDRIAQLVFNEVPQIHLQVVTELEDTSRGKGGFGSTGNR